MQAHRVEQGQRRRIGCVPVLLLAVLGLFIAYKAGEYRFRLNLIPAKLGVWWISSVNEDSLGLGPGGLETGVIVYSLPEATAREIRNRGLNFLAEGQPSITRKAPIYETWHETPIDKGPLSWEETRDLEGSSGSQTTRIADFLNRYGLGVHLAPRLERLIDEAIVSPGNYYFYRQTGGGVTIVIPSAQTVVLAYAG
jgi:hypothetical protein